MFSGLEEQGAASREETFFLIKPDAHDQHAAIMKTLYDAGFQILARQFKVTAGLADFISSRYPSVVQAKLKETYTPQPSTSNPQANSPAASSKRIEHHTDLLDQFRKLVRKDADVAQPEAPIVPLTKGGDIGPCTTGSVGVAALQRRHRLHLIGGTTLALVIAAPGAVTRAKELVGPEDPVVARMQAPTTLRALFGKDLVRNAVMCAENANDALHLIRVVFELDQRKPSTDLSVPSIGITATAAGTTERGPAMIHPPMEVAIVEQNAAAVAPDYLDGNPAMNNVLKSLAVLKRHASTANTEGTTPQAQQPLAETLVGIAKELNAEWERLKVWEARLRREETDLIAREKSLAQNGVPTTVRVSSVTVGPPTPRRGGSHVASKEPRIDPAAVDDIVASPIRLKRLFTELGPNADGVITADDFMRLYCASPCLGLTDEAPNVRQRLPALLDAEMFTVHVLALLRR